MSESNTQNLCSVTSGVMVPPEDARMIKKIHKIVDGGKDAEVRRDKAGKLKVLMVTKEIA